MHLIEQIAVAGVTVYFLGAMTLAHFFGRVGVPTLHNKLAHWLFDKHHKEVK